MSRGKDPAMPDPAEAEPPSPAFDRREFRNALGTFATGVTIVTARGRDGEPVGLTVNSFASVSLDPPLVLWSQSLYAQSLPAFQEASHFVINILAADQVELSKRFAGEHDNRFLDVEHIVPDHGAPVIAGCAAHFECHNEARHYGGDHVIFIGRVERFAYTAKPTLMFCHGRYMRGRPLETITEE
ncbi:MAG TPA: flavin reductase family protein [Stellaceae bacterium]|nr:flavin reductase family protein [Stellaceae bacterium]